MDEKLKSLLEVPENVQLTFLNLQHYLSKHYIKEEKPETEKKPRAKKETPVKTETPPRLRPSPQRRRRFAQRWQSQPQLRE
jgi:chromatin remodeling complex protein RSC6